MKAKGPLHAPRTGPGFSAGKAPPRITNSGQSAKATASQGKSEDNNRANSKGGVMSKAGDHAMLRKPY